MERSFLGVGWLACRFVQTSSTDFRIDFTILLFVLTFHQPAKGRETLRRVKTATIGRDSLCVSSFGIMLTRNALHKHSKSMATNKLNKKRLLVRSKYGSKKIVSKASHRTQPETIESLLFCCFSSFFCFSHSKNISIVQAITHATHPKQTMRIKDKTTKMMLRLTSSTQLRMNEGSERGKKL